MSGFLDIGKRVVFECTSCTHSEEKLQHRLIFFFGNLYFLANSYKNLKNKLIPVNTARNKSRNPQEKLRPENCHFFKIPFSNVTKHHYYLHIYISSRYVVRFLIKISLITYNCILRVTLGCLTIHQKEY